MATRGEYTTVTDVRQSYLGVSSNADDALLLDLIRSVSRDIDSACLRHFYPVIQTRYFNPLEDTTMSEILPTRRRLLMDDDLLAVTTLVNGDSTTIGSTSYILETPNFTPYWAIKLLLTSGYVWYYTVDAENAISVTGVWGYHSDYANAWLSVDTLGAAMSDTTGTTALLTNGNGSVKGGQLVKVDDEYMYWGTVADKSASNLLRGVNGSTAATHLSGAAVYVWQVDDAIQQVAKEAAAARYRLRDNPVGETVIMDGHSFATPKDVAKYIKARCSDIGLIRTGVL